MPPHFPAGAHLCRIHYPQHLLTGIPDELTQLTKKTVQCGSRYFHRDRLARMVNTTLSEPAKILLEGFLEKEEPGKLRLTSLKNFSLSSRFKKLQDSIGFDMPKILSYSIK